MTQFASLLQTLQVLQEVLHQETRHFLPYFFQGTHCPVFPGILCTRFFCLSGPFVDERSTAQCHRTSHPLSHRPHARYTTWGSYTVHNHSNYCGAKWGILCMSTHCCWHHMQFISCTVVSCVLYIQYPPYPPIYLSDIFWRPHYYLAVCVCINMLSQLLSSRSVHTHSSPPSHQNSLLLGYVDLHTRFLLSTLGFSHEDTFPMLQMDCQILNTNVIHLPRATV